MKGEKGMIHLTSVVKQGEGNMVSDMGGEKVMLSIRNGKYYNLGTIGGEIWSGMEDAVEVQQLAAALKSEYDVDPDDCERQVMGFLESLLKEGLIELEKN